MVMEIKSKITPEFEEKYARLDQQTRQLAYAILEHVKKNDVRLLKKIEIRLAQTIDDINNLQ
jgi:mRNA-degrading endonuclease RelE of RelBE toxin-antitoxin system